MTRIISSNQTEVTFQMDYKSLEYMLLSGDAEQYESVKSLFENYDAKDMENKNDIESATKFPLYVVHGVECEGLVLEYSAVYDACLDLIGFLD